MKVNYNLDFDVFLAEVGVVLMEIFSNQAEFDAIYQLCSTSSFFLKTIHLNIKTI